ncbi:MAG: 50S ribosomal protein L10, partial [Deinococcus sp.]|nr:50S ribosomal protein L10 [Deinococcus sp.]
MPRPEKATQVAVLEQAIAGSGSFFLVEYQLRGQGQGKGLTASEMTALRRKVRQSGARLLVAKNTLVGVAVG